MTSLAVTRAIERSGGHLYTYREGDQTLGPFPGATAITSLQDSLGGSDGLMNWGVNLALDAYARTLSETKDWDLARREALEAKDAPRNIGTAVHAAVDAFNRKLPLELTDRTAAHVAQYGAALYQRGIKILGSERYVVNTDIGAGGTVDSVVEIDGERGPMDVKSGKEKASQRIQLTILSMGQWWGEAGIEAEPMPKLDSVGWILLLRPDGYELVRHEITDADREHVIHLVETFHRIKRWAAEFAPTQLREEIAA